MKYAMTRLSVVVGGQFGSEAKGHVTARLVDYALATAERPILLIRVAGPNAGHTAHDGDGNAYAFRQIPVGVVRQDVPAVAPRVAAFIAPGSEIDVDVLLAEIQQCKDMSVPLELYVDPEATLIEDEHKAAEQGRLGVEGEDLQQRIGSTAKGIGAARAGRIMRKAKRISDDVAASALLRAAGVNFVRAQDLYDRERWSHIIIEGTQGYGLGLHAGFYPYCTSSDCRAIDFLAMAGISPWSNRILYTDVWVTARMFPIRVAGNSGPLLRETTWEELNLPPEYTTVTKKMRRVGLPDWGLVREAVTANGGAEGGVKVALTMFDQMFPVAKGATEADNFIRSQVRNIEAQVGTKIGMVTTGPNSGIWL